MGYLPLNLPTEGTERDLLFDMWNQLEGEARGGVLFENLKTILLAVSGINNDHASHGTAIQFDVDGNIDIPISQETSVFIKYKPLYVNRIQHVGAAKKRVLHEDQCSFKPQLSKTTELLAQEKRKKMLSGQNQEAPCDIVSILLDPRVND